MSTTANSADAVGVGARRSATKSAIVKSTSWPTALIIGLIVFLPKIIELI